MEQAIGGLADIPSRAARHTLCLTKSKANINVQAQSSPRLHQHFLQQLRPRMTLQLWSCAPRPAGPMQSQLTLTLHETHSPPPRNGSYRSL